MPNIYLPIIISDRTSLGVHMESDQTEYLAPNSWIRLWVKWDEIEASHSNYIWSQDELITKLAGHPLLLNIKNSPVWAQTFSACCSMPADFNAYCNFVLAIIERYHPQGIEIWNEPDVSPNAMTPDLYPYMGCWGDDKIAGQKYAALLSIIYPAVKAQFPNVLVFGGALVQPKGQFWTGAIQAGINNYLDVVSYHQYVGGSFTPPIDIAKMLSPLSPGKPLALTETSYLYDVRTVKADQMQAEYLNYLLSSAKGAGIDYIFWYTLAKNYWRHSDLVEEMPKPAWDVYQNYLK